MYDVIGENSFAKNSSYADNQSYLPLILSEKASRMLHTFLKKYTS